MMTRRRPFPDTRTVTCRFPHILRGSVGEAQDPLAESAYRVERSHDPAAGTGTRVRGNGPDPNQDDRNGNERTE
jgi:hypothetical protein